MRFPTAVVTSLFCATFALGQIIPPGSRRPDPVKPTDPAVSPGIPPTSPTVAPAPKAPIPENFPGKLPPLVATSKLSEDLLTVEIAGLTMSLPEKSIVVQGANTEGSVYRIVDEAQNWAIEVQVHRTSNAEATVHDTAALVRRNVEQLAPVVTPGRGEIQPRLESGVELLQRLTQFTIAGCGASGERLYFAVPGAGSRRVLGYTILKPMPTTFVIFELSCDESKFEKARAAYELSIATAKFEDPSRVIQARAEALTAGTEFLAELSDEKLARLGDGNERWFRWSKPAGAAAGGDREAMEVGYRVQRVTKGRRSDIGAEGGGGRDNPSGLIVSTQVRLLQRVGGSKVSSIIDSDTKAFTSYDRKDEAWVTTTIVRDLKKPDTKPAVFTETGVRSGNSMSIVTRQPGQPDSVVQPTLRNTQYVSVGEAPLLGSLLVLDAISIGSAAEGGKTPGGEFGFYAYRADTGTVSLRRETVARDAARANAWTVRSRQRDEKASTLSVYRDDGTLVRSELVDGSVWEPIEPEALLKLWKGKNLPLK
ncbi:MAG TPA: hypothetical protein VEB22_03940 [Phycisphaerales bacterium]|nr:hypothetical protein [Phycisphaerales bacterium]